jgi:thiol:disulfide interchange protein DsbC
MSRPFIALLAFVAALFTGAAMAQDEAAIRRAVEGLAPEFKVEGISKAGFLNLYEVRVMTPRGLEIFYADESGTYLFAGSVIDTKAGEDLTDKRIKSLTAMRFKDLPFNQAFKIVRGKGTRQFAYFSDPRCPYCKKFDQEIVKMDDVTVHVFLLPIIAPDSAQLSRAVWCSSDRAKAWQDWMLNGVMPSASGACPNPIDRNLELGRKLRVNGTPMLMFADSQRISGWVPVTELSKRLDDAQAKKQ